MARSKSPIGGKASRTNGSKETGVKSAPVENAVQSPGTSSAVAVTPPSEVKGGGQGMQTPAQHSPAYQSSAQQSPAQRSPAQQSSSQQTSSQRSSAPAGTIGNSAQVSPSKPNPTESKTNSPVAARPASNQPNPSQSDAQPFNARPSNDRPSNAQPSNPKMTQDAVSQAKPQDEIKSQPEAKMQAEAKSADGQPEARKLEVMKPESRKNLVPINLEDEIRRRAYELYQQRGTRGGSEAEDWFTAEREIRQRYRQQSA